MKRKLLFTPGPLNTSASVKEAMLRDVGSRDKEFIDLIRNIRRRLLELGGVSQARGFEAVLIQGSGTFGIESVISSVVPPNGKLLIIANGAYGERIVKIAAGYHLPHEVLRCPENQAADPRAVQQKLQNSQITHVAAVHCETTTGILNPINDIGPIVHAAKRTFIVDAMSSFGAIPISLQNDAIDFLVSSANKCIQGVPGFSFALASREKLAGAKGLARTLSLDLYEQWRGLEQDGQFRFTPPTHTLLAFAQALDELDREGGVAGRHRRYFANQKLLASSMAELGFVPYLQSAVQSPIITAFHYPTHPNFRFDEFYSRLSALGMVIYPGKLTTVECFRLGNIGDLHAPDMHALLNAIKKVLADMNIPIPVPGPVHNI
ncbi:MAG TPA: 2-aminoethylphosphonate--pyruvate transaminase [Verrucomicrobiae bacterium]